MGNLFPGRESFSVGHPGLDDEHRRMVGLINDIVEAPPTDANADAFAALLRRLR